MPILQKSGAAAAGAVAMAPPTLVFNMQPLVYIFSQLLSSNYFLVDVRV